MAIQTYVAFIALFYVTFNSVVDILIGVVDPRTRNRRA